jgi:hypothetical protein
MWNKYLKENVFLSGQRSFPFLPGLAFILLGLLVLFAPRLLITAVAGLLFLVGGLLCFVAWKFIQFKRQLASLTRELDGKIQVQAFHVRNSDATVVEVEEKKIVYH